MAETFVCHDNASRIDYVDGQWVTSPFAPLYLATTPFAKGGLRSAFHAYHGSAPDLMLVAKRFLKDDDAAASEMAYRNDVAQQVIAHKIGEAFNTYNPPKRVEFLTAFLVRVRDPASGAEQTYACEKKLGEGKFVKFSDNAGFVSPDVRNTPHALSHFSWHHSAHTLLIADVQGVGDCFTDPGVQSMDRRFGHTDLGVTGIAFFFSSHVCNPICESLGLRPWEQPQSQSGAPRYENPIAMVRGKTMPKLMRQLTDAQVTKPVRDAASAGLVLPLPDAAAVPKEATPEALVHLALAGLHETGRLAILHASLKAAIEGAARHQVDEEPDAESALFHYQKAAFAGSTEAMMILAQVHAGFAPRDYLADLSVEDKSRAMFLLNLAAARGNRNAVLHLGDERFANGDWAAALQHYERALALPRPPAPPAATDDDDGVDTLGLLKELPTNVWAHTTPLPNLYATMAEAYEKSGDTAKACEFYSSASEEALADPLMAKQGLKWADKAAALE